MSTNSSLRPYLDVIVRHSAVIRNIRIDYSSKHLGLSCSGMAGGKYQLLFSQMDTAVEWIPDCLESATMVRVTGGPLTGLVGELDTSDTGFRIRIRFHSMGCFRVAVPEEWIEKF